MLLFTPSTNHLFDQCLMYLGDILGNVKGRGVADGGRGPDPRTFEKWGFDPPDSRMMWPKSGVFPIFRVFWGRLATLLFLFDRVKCQFLFQSFTLLWILLCLFHDCIILSCKGCNQPVWQFKLANSSFSSMAMGKGFKILHKLNPPNPYSVLMEQKNKTEAVLFESQAVALLGKKVFW